MTYEPSLGIYATVWVGVLGTLMLMGKWIETKSRTLFAAYVDRIEGKNADLGLPRSFETSKIALDILIPYRHEHIARYAQNIGLDECTYIDIMHRDVGRPRGLIALVTIYACSIGIAFLGPIFYFLSGYAFLAEYFILLLVSAATTLIIYLIS